MEEHLVVVARMTLEGAESGAMNFPQGVMALIEAGFDGYAVDYRAATRSCYLRGGEAVTIATAPVAAPVAERFDAATVRAAIAEAQADAPGYSYHGFCAKTAAAGCAGYVVSFPGKRVLYYGRDGATHTEYFPGSQP